MTDRVSQVLVVGWDGAEPDLVERLVAAGRMPVLKSLRERGRWGRLASTMPPSSLPAWTTALTGLVPARHGVIDFLRRRGPGRELALGGAHERVVPTILGRLAAAGVRVVSLGVPGTHPAEAGVLSIPGSDSPLRQGGQELASPGWFLDWLHKQRLTWPAGVWEMWTDAGWHERLAGHLLDRLEAKVATSEAVLRHWHPQLAWVVFNEFDTAAHHCWALQAEGGGPRRRGWPPGRRLPADSCRQVLERLDRGLGRLCRTLDPDRSVVLVVSDHGFGANADRIVYPNRLLARAGWLRFKRPGATARVVRLAERVAESLPVQWLQPLAPLVSPRLALELERRRRLGCVDFKNSVAWCDEMPQHPGIWLAVSGRDRPGLLAPGRSYLAARRQLTRQLLDWRDGQGRRVVARVYTREDLGAGPLQRRLPDLLLDLARRRGCRLVAGISAGPGPEWRRLQDSECLSGKGIGISGSHRPLGLICAAGPGISPGWLASARLADLAPTILALLARPWPDHLDGRPLPELVRAAPASAAEPPVVARPRRGPNANLLRQLRNLGYLQ